MKLLIAAAIAAITTAAPGLTSAALAQAATTPTEKNAQSKLEAAGYSQIRDIKSGPEGVTAKAVKDGREVAVVVDSAGKIKELRTGP